MISRKIVQAPTGIALLIDSIVFVENFGDLRNYSGQTDRSMTLEPQNPAVKPWSSLRSANSIAPFSIIACISFSKVPHLIKYSLNIWEKHLTLTQSRALAPVVPKQVKHCLKVLQLKEEEEDLEILAMR